MSGRQSGSLPAGPYPWIRAWGWMLGSHGYYIEGEIALAKEDHAPADAIFHKYVMPEHPTHTVSAWTPGAIRIWHRASEIENTNTRYVLEREFGELPRG